MPTQTASDAEEIPVVIEPRVWAVGGVSCPSLAPRCVQLCNEIGVAGNLGWH